MSLLDKIAARSFRQVKLKSLPTVDVYVRTITYAEFISLGESVVAVGIKDDEASRKARKAIEVETLLVDVDGNPLLAKGEGAQFVDKIYAADMHRITQTSEQLNGFSDDRVEEASKN